MLVLLWYMLGNVGVFILDYTEPKYSTVQLSYVIKFNGQNIDTQARYNFRSVHIRVQAVLG
jgi:hypothetical protein